MERDLGKLKISRRAFITAGGLTALEFAVACVSPAPSTTENKQDTQFESQLIFSEPKDGSSGRYSITLRKNALLQKLTDRKLLNTDNTFEMGFTPRSSTSSLIVAQILGRDRVVSGWATIFDGDLSREHRIQTLFQNWKFIDVLIDGEKGNVVPLT
jgi:hypothetical protein